MDTPVRSQKAVSEPTQVSASKRIMSKVERRIRWKGIVAQPEVRMREDNSSAQKYSLTLCCIDQAFGWFLLSGPWELCTQRLDCCDIPVEWDSPELKGRVGLWLEGWLPSPAAGEVASIQEGHRRCWLHRQVHVLSLNL